jgi:hypothetical protein
MMGAAAFGGIVLSRRFQRRLGDGGGEHQTAETGSGDDRQHNAGELAHCVLLGFVTNGSFRSQLQHKHFGRDY